MYEKRPFSKFNGKKHNFPSFKQDWSETVTGKYAREYELRLIRENLPAEIRPDIKNLKLMMDVWKILDDKYGQVMELTSELIKDLISF